MMRSLPALMLTGTLAFWSLGCEADPTPGEPGSPPAQEREPGSPADHHEPGSPEPDREPGS